MADVQAPRRLTPKGRETRDRIVRAAADLIFAHGVASTSIDDVRQAAGASGSQMTHYFPDKRSLVRAVIAFHEENVMSQHRQPELGGLDSFEALELCAEHNIARQRDASGIGSRGLSSLAGEVAETDPGIRADLAGGFVRWEALFRYGLQAMRDRGQLRPDADPAVLAAGLLASLQGGMLLARTTRDVRYLESALGAALEHVRSYAAAPDPAGSPT
jgi:TetR/AcrR family transcriptional regulator, transcriptional repressor for nem operon